MNKIFFGIIGFILLMIILVAILAKGGNGDKPKTANVVTLKSLPSYANTGATVSLTTQGIVNGEDIHRSIRITVGENERVLQVIQGYNNQVITSQVFPNNSAAYDVFLRSIGGQGFLVHAKAQKPPVSDNENGYCPLGYRYIYELNQGEDDLSRLWSSSCGTKVGTFGGNASTIQRLFQLQITNYNTLVSNVNLSSQ